ncbi:MAG: 5-guanidino-2-oxopentanoate decarboxylase [Rhodospirillales bacterium]
MDEGRRVLCGEALVALLANYGIDRAFGIPGVHTVELYRGLGRQRLQHTLTRHEQGAGFMADGYARASGRPAACFLISGPGLTNAATPIAQAYSDSQPMVVIATTNRRREIGKSWGPFHELRNQRLIAEQFCGYAGQALCPEDIPEILAQAMATLSSGRPRPVYLEIPRDILAEPAVGDWRCYRPARRPAPRAEEVAEAAALLAVAERPLVLVGAGAAEADEALLRIVERLGAVAISSFCGKGVVPESHPQVLGAALSLPEARDLVARADVALAIGTELSSVDASNQTLSFGGRLIRVDIDPRKMSDRYPADVAILADARLTAEALAQQLAGGDDRPDRRAWQAELDRVRRRFRTFGAPKAGEHRRVLDALRRALPADGIVVGDMTQLAYSGNHAFPVERPRSWLHPASYATLGYALPTAIGAKVARPERPVVSLAGDCGFLFTCQEMATAAELKLPIVQVLWNNEALGEIRDAMIAAEIAPVAVEGQNPDFLALARSFHWQAERADSLDRFEALVAGGLAGEGPTLIELREGQGDWAA